MGNEIITVAVKRPGVLSWYILDIPNTLKDFQNIVGGPIELFHQSKSGILYFCNEEGKLLGLAPNFYFNQDMIVGNVFAIRSDEEGEFVSLTPEDIAGNLLSWSIA